MGKVKNQHYVPRFYLEMFAENSKVHLFDKEKNEYRKQDVKKVATQRYFYDFSEDEILQLEELFPNISKQYIEEHFAIEIEPVLKESVEILQKFFYELENEEEEYVLADEFKVLLSTQMAYQFLRTPRFRELISILNMDSSLVQRLLLLNQDVIAAIANFFYTKRWFIRVIKGRQTFYTSDNPVVIHYMNDNKCGLKPLKTQNRVQIFYPCTSKVLINLEDENISEALNEIEIEKIEITDDFEIEYINNLQVQNSSRFIFSNNENFDVSFSKINSQNVTVEDEKKLDELLDEQISLIEKGNFYEKDILKFQNEIAKLKDKYSLN